MNYGMSRWVFIKCRGQKAWIFVICVGFVDFASGGDRGLSRRCSGFEHSMLEVRGENSKTVKVSICLGV